ncbi:MAG: hypothetical protein ACXVCY_16005 [Pseudobdellovibrionaceae bacterium]
MKKLILLFILTPGLTLASQSETKKYQVFKNSCYNKTRTTEDVQRFIYSPLGPVTHITYAPNGGPKDITYSPAYSNIKYFIYNPENGTVVQVKNVDPEMEESLKAGTVSLDERMSLGKSTKKWYNDIAEFYAHENVCNDRGGARPKAETKSNHSESNTSFKEAYVKTKKAVANLFNRLIFNEKHSILESSQRSSSINLQSKTSVEHKSNVPDTDSKDISGSALKGKR